MNDLVKSNAKLAEAPKDARDKVKQLVVVLKYFDSAEDRQKCEKEIKHLYGLSRATLYRKYYLWKSEGEIALLPKPLQKKILEEKMTYPPEFLDYLKVKYGTNQRKNAPAWRSLIDDELCKGKHIPGYGTWREIYAAEHRGWAIPENCPYSRRGNFLPRGWSERHLRRKVFDRYQAVAVRIGTAAAKDFLPSVPSTRIGLPFGRVFMIDDVEHDAKVTFVGNMQPQGVVELGALELLTGCYCSWGAKPIRLREDGTREKAKEAFNRYLLAHILCAIGFSREGCLIVGEHGTAKVSGELLQAINRHAGGLVEFTAGGILNKPIAAGLPLGARRGNFRLKAALESHHNLKKNELAALPGQKGADPKHQPEDLPSKVQMHEAVMKACVALAEQDPDLCYKVQTDFVSYFKYIALVGTLYERINHRIDHKLEGWEELGFTKTEWRLPAIDPLWKPIETLEDMGEENAEAIRSVIRRNPEGCIRERKMSPGEAFDYCRRKYEKDLIRLPEYAVPEILGVELADRVSVGQDNSLTIPNRLLPNRSYSVTALVRHQDGSSELLERGREVMVWLSPYDGRKAYVATSDGAFLGVAPVMIPGTKIDLHTTHRNMAVVSEVQKKELDRLAPVAAQRMQEYASRAEHNVRLLAGKQPSDIISAVKQAAQIGADADAAINEIGGE